MPDAVSLFNKLNITIVQTIVLQQLSTELTASFIFKRDIEWYVANKKIYFKLI